MNAVKHGERSARVRAARRDVLETLHALQGTEATGLARVEGVDFAGAAWVERIAIELNALA